MEGWPALAERLLLVVLAFVLPGVGGSPGEAAAAIRPELPEELPGEEATAARPAEAEAAAQPLHWAEAGVTLQPYQVEVAERQSQEAGAEPPRRSQEEAAAEVGPTCMLLYVLCYVPDFSAPINSRYNITDQQTVRNSQAKV